MVLPKIWLPWSNVETAARGPFTWRSISNKWIERDRSASFRLMSYPHVETLGAFSGGDNGAWEGIPSTDWDFHIPRETESLLFRIWWWYETTGVTSAKIKVEVDRGSGNFTGDSLLNTLKDIPKWSDVVRDISADAIDGTRVTMRLFQNVVFSTGSNLHHFQVTCTSYQSTDDLN